MPLRHLIRFTGVSYLAYCYIKISPHQSLDYMLTVIPDKARVGWNNIMSQYVSVTNAVKQGGILSSVLFSLYIKALLQTLRQSGVGFHIMVILWEFYRMLMILLLFSRVFGD